MAESYGWVCSQLRWTIWYSTCTESCTRGRTRNREVLLESQMISKMAVFIPRCFLQTHCRIISHIFSFQRQTFFACSQLWLLGFQNLLSSTSKPPLDEFYCSKQQSLGWFSSELFLLLSSVTCFDSLILFPPPLNKCGYWLLPVITEANRQLR